MQKTTQRYTVFIFDLHDVIVKKNYLKIIIHLAKKIHRIDLLFCICKPSFIKRLLSIFQMSRVPEQFIVELAQLEPRLLPFITFVITVMNEQIPNHVTISIIDELKKKGCRLYLFSNIGERTFAHFKKQYPHIIAYFDDVLVVQQSDNWIQKPYPQAFEKCIKKFAIHPQDSVFIDNNKKNIQTAQYFGFHTIQYKCAEQLYHELKKIVFKNA